MEHKSDTRIQGLVLPTLSQVNVSPWTSLSLHSFIHRMGLILCFTSHTSLLGSSSNMIRRKGSAHNKTRSASYDYYCYRRRKSCLNQLLCYWTAALELVRVNQHASWSPVRPGESEPQSTRPRSWAPWDLLIWFGQQNLSSQKIWDRIPSFLPPH